MHGYRIMLRTGAAIAFALASMAQISVAASDQPKTEVCREAKGITLSGKVHSLQSMREEPQAEVQTFFSLELSAPLCGLTKVETSMIGYVPCLEGDTITLTGDFSPPDKMFNTASFQGYRIDSCSSGTIAPEAKPGRN